MSVSSVDNEPDVGGYTKLHIAASNGDVDEVKCLLAAGADVNGLNDFDHSALHFAAEHGYVEVVRLLVDHGADISDGTHSHI